MPTDDPLLALIQREIFIRDTIEIARLCHWNDRQLKDLKVFIWNRLVDLDNKIITVLKEPHGEEQAVDILYKGMEEIRYFVSLMLGIKIRYL